MCFLRMFQIGKTTGSLSLVFGKRERREQHSGENADDCDDDEQFDQGKPEVNVEFTFAVEHGFGLHTGSVPREFHRTSRVSMKCK